MKSITLKLYNFNELDKQAKEKALTKFRDLNLDFDWWNDEYDDFVALCSCLGVLVDKESIRFSGFYSQGDGSSFSASVDIPKLTQAIQTEAWRSYAPHQGFSFPLPVVDRRVMALVKNGILPNQPRITGRTRHHGVLTDLGIWETVDNGKAHDHVFDELEKLQEWMCEVAEKLNAYLHKSLERQYDFLTSETAIKESILNNEYLFTADGRSANHLLKLTGRKPQH